MGQFYFGDPAAKRVRITSALTVTYRNEVTAVSATASNRITVRYVGIGGFRCRAVHVEQPVSKSGHGDHQFSSYGSDVAFCSDGLFPTHNGRPRQVNAVNHRGSTSASSAVEHSQLSRRSENILRCQSSPREPRIVGTSLHNLAQSGMRFLVRYLLRQEVALALGRRSASRL